MLKPRITLTSLGARIGKGDGMKSMQPLTPTLQQAPVNNESVIKNVLQVGHCSTTTYLTRGQQTLHNKI